MRTLLPCDMRIPPALWMLPQLSPPVSSARASAATATLEGSPRDPVSSARASAATATLEGSPRDPIEVLRWTSHTDARLPYSAAMQALRTIGFQRSPTQKARVLLQASLLMADG